VIEGIIVGSGKLAIEIGGKIGQDRESRNRKGPKDTDAIKVFVVQRTRALRREAMAEWGRPRQESPIFNTIGALDLFDICGEESAEESDSMSRVKRGVFYVNQRIVPRYPSGTTTVDQMQVNYEIPDGDSSAVPIVLVPGGLHTSACYDETPDGRKGWRSLFVERKHPVYVAEHVGHGSSGFDQRRLDRAQLEGDANVLPELFSMSHEDMWYIFRFGDVQPQFHVGTQFPVDHIEHYWAQLIPNTEPFNDDPHSVTVRALVKLLERIGPAVLLVHSQSGPYAIEVAARTPNLVAGIVNIEPPGTKLHVATQRTSADLLTMPNPDHSQEKLAILARVPQIIIWGDFVDGHPWWTQLYSEVAEYVETLRTLGGIAVNLSLPELGIVGNSHMMMLEKNNIEISQVVLDWINKYCHPSRSTL
jgi:pimeloyl-ACP methyl ester carboxylesterase